MAAWDRDKANPNNFVQNEQGTGKQTQNISGQESAIQATSGRTSQSSFQQNMTPTALGSLDALILQLMDRPAISEAELDKQAPLPFRRYTRDTGWYWTDPLSGKTLSDAEAQKVTAERTAQREQLTQEAGIIPGGNQAQRAATVARTQTLKDLQTGVGDYSKAAAFEDAAALVQQAIRQVEEGQIASLTRSAEGAGTSQSAIRGLITNDLAARAGEAAGVAGINAAAQYGGIQAQLASVLGQISAEDPTTRALLEALGISRNAINVGGTVTDTSQVTTTQKQSKQDTTALNAKSEVLNRTAPAHSSAIDVANLSKIERGAVL